MMRTLAAVATFLIASLLPGCAEMKSMTGQSSSSALTGLLTQQLGVTETQATGGVGSILKLAQEKLSAGDFDQVAKAVPGADKYLAQARQLLGGGNVGDKAGLQSAFSKLGMGSDMVSKFSPIVTQFVGQSGGSQAGSLLAGVLK
ncbi:MAG TPA: DUF2780 domain-containing protein [Burkholderiales bacterium]|nr:DUF2780 domain-containing protein [Burkholderiales bacterium]